MHTYWDDPSGQMVEASGVSANSFKRAGKLLLPQRSVDLNGIRQAQREILYPHFNRLYRDSCEVLKKIDSLSRELGQSTLALEVTYRLPDAPSICTEFLWNANGPIIALVESGERLHPAVESVFPVTNTSTLPEEQQEDLLRQIRAKPGKAHLGLPKYVRTVMPRAAHFIMGWIAGHEGPISDLKIGQQPEKISDKARNSAPHLN